MRSIGIAGLMIALVSVAVAITLLPVVLATIGPRFDWPRNSRDASASRGWSAWARLVVGTAGPQRWRRRLSRRAGRGRVFDSSSGTRAPTRSHRMGRRVSGS